MKIKLKNTVTNASTGLTFFANKIYSAEIASNQPGALRLAKKSGVIVNKIFVGKAKHKEGETMLLEREDFTIVDFPEKDSVIEKYKSSKIKIPREKKIVPSGLKLRDGFRAMTDTEKGDEDFATCGMGSGSGADHKTCGRAAEFIKEINPRVKIGRCGRCACFVTK